MELVTKTNLWLQYQSTEATPISADTLLSAYDSKLTIYKKMAELNEVSFKDIIGYLIFSAYVMHHQLLMMMVITPFISIILNKSLNVLGTSHENNIVKQAVSASRHGAKLAVMTNETPVHPTII